MKPMGMAKTRFWRKVRRSAGASAIYLAMLLGVLGMTKAMMVLKQWVGPDLAMGVVIAGVMPIVVGGLFWMLDDV